MNLNLAALPTRHWSRRDKRTARRAGHGMLDKPLYPGESYNQRMSFGAYRPGDQWFDNLSPYEFVEIVRGRRMPPPGPRFVRFEATP